MTPMVDLAFLLVTFFMLTTKFRAQEPVTVSLPSSTSEIPVPPKDIIILTVSKEGQVYFDLNNQNYRKDLLQRMGKDYGVAFNDEELANFSNLGSFGVPMSQMKYLLDLQPEQRGKFKQTGIPSDSAHNELQRWILEARQVSNMPLAIKGDKGTSYDAVKQVIKTIQETPNGNRFNLITSLEAAPAGMKK
jgi:biopolymer transport protein ExbD